MDITFAARPELSEIVNGKFAPQRLTSEETSSCIFVCDGKDRVYGGLNNGSNFVVSTKSGEISRARKVRLASCIVPKLPNINVMNNTFVIVSEAGTTGAITIPPGYYNQVSLVNELKAVIDAAWALFGVPDSSVVNFNTLTKTISIQSVNGNKWFFTNTSAFIIRGINVAGFTGYPISSDPAVVGDVTQYSCSVGLIYSRYIYVSSSVLTQNVRTCNRISNGRTDIVGIVPITDGYSSSDFDSSNMFTGNLITDITISYSPLLDCNLSNRNLELFDFQFTDEFGSDLTDVLQLSDTFPASTFSCVAVLIFVV